MAGFPLQRPTQGPFWKQVSRLAVAVGLLLVTAGVSAWGQELEWQSFEEALAIADTSNQPVFVHIYAPWCGWCHKMRTEVYPSEAVRECLADQFVLARLNRDDTDTMHRYRGQRFTARQLATTLRADAVPTIVLLAPDGRYLLHLSGFVEPTPLRTVLSFVSTGAYRETSFEAFRAQESGRCNASKGGGAE